MSGNMTLWNKLKRPPQDALKQIKGGRLSGMTDISPQWRYMALTEIFGPCGVGWKYEITNLWTEQGSEEQVTAFATVNLFTYRTERDSWSDPTPGIGGSMLIAKEKGGLHTSDEAYKMAVTDALSVAMKMLGVAADVYLNNMDGSKYRQASAPQQAPAIDKQQQRDIDGWVSIWNAAKAQNADPKAWWEEKKAGIIKDCGKVGAEVVLAEVKK